MPRNRAWIDSRVIILLTATQVSIDLLGSPKSDTITQVRSIGRLFFAPNLPDAVVTGNQFIDMGIGVVTADALTAGAVPDPAVAGDSPARGWVYRSTVGMHHNNSSGTLQGYLYPIVTWDVVGQRKVDKGKLILTMDKGVLSGTAFNLDVIGLVRTLCLT